MREKEKKLGLKIERTSARLRGRERVNHELLLESWCAAAEAAAIAAAGITPAVAGIAL